MKDGPLGRASAQPLLVTVMCRRLAEALHAAVLDRRHDLAVGGTVAAERRIPIPARDNDRRSRRQPDLLLFLIRLFRAEADTYPAAEAGHDCVARRLERIGKTLNIELTEPTDLIRAGLALTTWRLLNN